MGEIYERELKNLLNGDEKALLKMTRTGDEEEKNGYLGLRNNPFLVIRAAGSLGVDLVALRWDFSFPIEVKSSQTDVLRFSSNPHLAEQAERMSAECSRSCLIPMYAFRLKGFKGDPWRIFTLPLEKELEGRIGMLQRKIPCIELNNNGNYIMRWQEGMKLSKLLTYLDYVSGTMK